jgi:hypothetical protein
MSDLVKKNRAAIQPQEIVVQRHDLVGDGRRIVGSIELADCHVEGVFPDATARDIARLLTAAGMSDRAVISAGPQGEGHRLNSTAQMWFDELQMVLVEDDGKIVGLAFLGERGDQ